MQSAVYQKPVTAKSHSNDAKHANNVKHKTSDETGTKAGMPVFLQRASASTLPTPSDKQQTCNECEQGPVNNSPLIQTRLTIGASDDPYEREADAVADRVMSNQPAGPISRMGSLGSTPKAQRQSEESGDDEKEEEEEPVQTKLIQRQPEDEEEESVQTKLIQRQPEDEEEEPVQTRLLQRQPEDEEEEPVQTRLIQRQPEDEEEEPVQTRLIQRQPEEEEEEPVQTRLIQRQPEEEEEPVQTRLIQRQPEEEEEEPVQARLIQRQSEDEAEEEAEEETPPQAQLVQRKGNKSRGSEENPVQTKAQINNSAGVVKRKGRTTGSRKTSSTGALSGALAQSGTGESLSASVKNAMESSTGLDFSAVRIHSNDIAHRANRAIRARAFAHGLDIWLGRGESQHDRRLMAHELTHVVQQTSSNGGIQKLQRKPSAPQQIGNDEYAPDNTQDEAGETVTTENVVQTSPDISRQALEGNNRESQNESGTEVDQPPEEPVEKSADVQGRGDDAGEDEPSAVRLPIDQDPDAEEVAEEPPVETPAVQQPQSRPAGLIQRQQEDCPPAEPVPEVEIVHSPASPWKDPAFNKAKQRVKNRAKNQAQHGTGDEKSNSANSAAEVKAGEKKSHGQKAQVGEMDARAKKPPVFDKKAFVDQVLAQVKKIAPKTVDDFIKFASRGKADDVKNAVTGQVKQSQKKSQGPLDKAARKDPGAGQSPRTATTLKIEPAGKRPGSVRADRAMPPPRTDSEVDFQTDAIRTENILKEACITREYMDKYNDPELKAGAEAQDQLKQSTSESPQKYRQEEAATLAGARARASSQGKEGIAQMFGERSGKFEQVGDNQQFSKSENEGKRDAAASEIDGIFKLTQLAVQQRLIKLDIDVETTFDREAGKASQKFQSFVDKKAKSLKKSAFESLVEVVSDFLFGPPPRDAEIAYESGRRTFVQELTAVIKKIAGLVETGLKDARKIVEKGKLDVKTKLDSLGSDLDDFKQQKAEEMNDRFRSLEGEITKKQSDIIKSLANRYVNTLKAAKKAEKSIRDKYKNIVERAKDVYNKLKDAVLGWIEKLKAVVGGAAKRIIRQPGKFLRNLGAGIVQGFTLFMGNIGENIKGAVVEWLTGNLAGTVSLPKTFDARGIIGFLLELVGLGVANIKNIARKVFGRRVVALIEKGVAGAEKIKQIFDILAAEGPAGLFKFLAGEFEKMKEQVMGQAGKALAEGLVVAGIKKALGVISGLVSGGIGSVITIVMTIIDVVMWIRDNAARIAELVSTIAGMAMAILNGQVAAIAGAINNVLKRLLPLVLGFVGALVGIGGVVRKIQNIFKAIRKPATRVITRLFRSFKKLVQKLIAKVKKKFGKSKAKAKGKEKKLSPGKVRRLIISALKKPAKSDDPAKAIAETKALATSLKSKYQPKLKKGTIKITILDQTVEGVEKDDDIDMDVALSPGTKVARKVNTTLTRKFKRQISRSHDVAKDDIRILVGQIKKSQSNIKNWDSIKKIINKKSPLNKYINRPVDSRHAFGKEVTNLAETGVNKVKAASNNMIKKAKVGINAGSGFYARPKALFIAHIYNKSASQQKIINAVTKATEESFKDKPAEPYNRKKHYGKTPTSADRTWFENNRASDVKAAKNEQKKHKGNTDWVLDHEPPLVTRYYKGASGEKPGYKMTPGERKYSAKDKGKMNPQPRYESDSQGGVMAAKSRAYKKEFFG